jgi:amino acid transporter
MPTGLDKLLIIAVLTSASASTQTTILPGTRAALAMAAHGAAPKRFASIHPSHLTPGFATIAFGVISIAYYVILTMVSGNILSDSITATGLMIVFYLGITGVACVIYFRKALFNDLRTFVLAGLGPALGAVMMGYIFVKSAIEQFNPDNSESGKALLGMGPPLTIALLGLLLGLILMLLQWRSNPAFFRRKAETADAEMRL